MAKKHKLDGLCVCGHNPEEDPNEDCERCWLVTQVRDMEIAAVEDMDTKTMLRAELAAANERAGRAERERDGLRSACEAFAALRIDQDSAGEWAELRRAWDAAHTALAAPAEPREGVAGG